MSTLAKPTRAPRLSDGFVTLEQLDSRFLDSVFEAVNHVEIRALTATKATFSRSEISTWLESLPGRVGRFDWAIMVDGQYVGEIVLNEYDELKQTCNLRIALSRPEHFSKGYGSAALALVVEHGLEQLGLSKILLSVLETNQRAINAYEKIGFVSGRSFSEGKLRFRRMSLNKFDRIKALAETLMAQHLDVEQWSFGWDNARRRAGLCSYTDKRISLSTYYAQVHSIDEALQVMLHEIAHALAGKDAGHTKKWLALAKSIGYRNEKFTGKEIAEEFAPWVGSCPAGHEHFRYRKPTRALSCARCGSSFSRKNLISWRSR